MRFSIIIGFRNRDLNRVKRSLDAIERQTFSDFEVIFVDYGSDFECQQETKALVRNYPFVNYVFANTQGCFWNRSHGLNIGAKLAKGEVLLFSDIDLILPANFLERLSSKRFDNNFYTFSCYYQAENINYDELNDEFKENSNINYVGLCAIKNKYWREIGGFDEYYMHWGGEDDDFYLRLENIGAERTHLGVEDFPVVHQWHKAQKPSFPTLWYLEIIHHLYNNNNHFVKNINDVGIITTPNERICFEELNEEDIITFNLYPNKLFQFNLFLEGFFKLNGGEKCKFVFPIHKSIVPSLGRKEIVLNFINTIIKKVGLSIAVDKQNIIHALHDIQKWNEFVMYFIGKNRKLIRDYKIVETESEVTLYLQKL